MVDRLDDGADATLGLPHLEDWAATMDVTQPDKCEAFFPTIARYAVAFNLIAQESAERRRGNVAGSLRRRLDAGAGCRGGSRLALRDRFSDLRDAASPEVAGFPRFTPSTVTILVQDAATKP